jgi:hypothetical protein
MIDAKTLNSETDRPPAARYPPPPLFWRVGGACSFAVAAIFVFQEFVLRLAPGPSTAAEWLAAPLAPLERVRMGFMFALFFLSLLTYAGVAFRADNDAARAGLVFGTIACTVELAYRAVEMDAVPAWAETYRQTQDPSLRALLQARIEAFGDVTTAIYDVIRGAAMLTSLCFGGALFRGSGWQRTVALLFFANAARLGLNYTKPFVPALAPILDGVFIVVLAPLYGCVGWWLWLPEAHASSAKRPA